MQFASQVVFSRVNHPALHLIIARHVGCVSRLLRFIHMFREQFERAVRKMKRRNLRRSLGRVQRLEDRRLLAADLSVVELAPVENAEPEICQVADLESEGDVEDLTETLDLDTTEIPVDVVEEAVDEVQSEVDADDLETVEISAHDLGDPVDGTDGFFGSIDAENTSQTLAFSPSEGGLIDVVVASSFGDAETHLSITDSSGEIVASTMTEELSGFQVLSFEAEAGETFELTVGSEEGAEGYFQVTVEHNEIPEPIDLHADSIGEDSTLIQFVDGSSELTGDIELAGDIDTFRFTTDSNGEVSLKLAELNAGNATELQVQVLDADGQMITRGITNETVGISFDVESGSEYFIAVSAGEDQTGTFQLNMNLEAEVVELDIDEVAVDEAVVDEAVVDESVEVDETLEDDQAVDVDSVESDDVAAEDVASDPAIEFEPEVVDEMCDEVGSVGPETDPVNETEGNIPVEVIEAVEETTDTTAVDDIPEDFEPEDIAVESDVEEEDEEPVDAVVDDVIEADLPIEDSASDEPLTDFEPIGESIDDEMEICFTDLEGEFDFADSFFAEFDPSSIFTVNDRYELRRMS